MANFFPPGNYVGQHESNVFPAKKGKVPKFMNANATGRTGYLLMSFVAMKSSLLVRVDLLLDT